MDVHGYVAILDATIEKMLAGRHAGTDDPPRTEMSADYVMVGGFLGAGKTTALLRLAEHFTAQGRRVGLITNDQSQGLVDTSMVNAQGYPVEEITGGCFCCRFNSLTDAADRLTRDAQPDVFLAEPVGSCTDLRATVQYPLRRLYGDGYRVAPLSVLVDPTRAARILGLETGRTFSPKVQYIYEKQLEEADLIVINKSDLLSDTERDSLERALQSPLRSGGHRHGERPDWREPGRLVRAALGPARLAPGDGGRLRPLRGRRSAPRMVERHVPAVGGDALRRQPVPAAAGRRRPETPGRSRNRDCAFQDDAVAGHRQQSRGPESRADRQSNPNPSIVSPTS